MLIAGLIAVGIYRWWTRPLPETISQAGTAPLIWGSQKLANVAQALPNLTLKQIAGALLTMFGGYLLLHILVSILGERLGKNVVLAVRWKDTLRRIALASVLSTFGFLAALIHVYVFDKRFLKLGSMKTLQKKRAP